MCCITTDGVTSGVRDGSHYQMAHHVRHLVTCLALCGFAVPVCDARAQRLGHVGIEGTLGAARVQSGIPFTSQAWLAADAALTVRLRKEAGHSLIAGATTSMFYKGGADAVCRLLPDGSCAPHLPNFSSRSLLIGWEALSRQKESVRMMVGPAWFRRNTDTTTVGFQTRLDLGTHMTGRLGFVVSGRWSHLPDFRGRAVNFFATGLGFRLK
jgi:hypothetical protein